VGIWRSFWGGSLAALTLAASACGQRQAPQAVDAGDGPGAELAHDELEYRDLYAKTPLAVSGRVLDRSGIPLAGAVLALGNDSATSDAGGRFTFGRVVRRNALLVVEMPGFRVERLPVMLALPLEQTASELPPILLFPDELARLSFGGDVQFGRRYLDTTGSAPLDAIPPDDPAALIRASNPGPGTASLLAPIKPWLSDADFASVNLATVVTDTPATPDLDDASLFFTLPGSLPPLRDAGVDYVANGNDHIDDYADAGVSDTLAALDEVGLLHSGAGVDADAAFEAARTEIRGVPYAFLSFVSIEGLPVPNATETRSGSADLDDDDRVTSALARERDAGFVPIAELHTGYEYSEAPLDDTTMARMESVADAGAALVVCHHPHVAQGFAFHDGTLIAHSLGNLVFDQDRMDAELGLLLSVDLDGERLVNAEARGVFLDDYVPRPITGHVHDLMLQRLGESSAPWGTLVMPYGASAWVMPPERADELETVDRHISEPFHMGNERFALVDLRHSLEPGESILSVSTKQTTTSLRIGRDLLVLGDMEDQDVDDTDLEAPAFETSDLARELSSYVCRKDAYRGAAALCSIRDEASTTEATMTLREPLRVLGDTANLPNKALTLLAMVSANGAGPVRVEARYSASLGDEEFGVETPIELAPGSYNWIAEVHDLHMPPDSPDYPRSASNPYDSELRRHNARALRLTVSQGPSRSGAGIFRIDDMAVIAWQEELDPRGTTELDVPHPREFLRVEGEPGVYVLDVTVRKRVPKPALAP